MNDQEDLARRHEADQERARLRDWHERNVPGAGGFIVDLVDVERFMATNPTPEQAQDWLEQLTESHEKEQTTVRRLLDDP